MRSSTPIRPLSRVRIIWAAAAAAAFALPIAWTLASPPALDRVERPMAPEDATSDARSIPFPDVSASNNGERVHAMSLSSPSPMDILQHPELRILFSLDELRLPHPASARLEVLGTPCAYEAAGGIADGRMMTFVRGGPCRPAGAHPTGELKLTVTMTGPGELRVWTTALPDLAAKGLMYVRDPRPEEAAAATALRGRFIDYLPDNGLKRAHLLSYMWTYSTRVRALVVAFGGVTLLVFAGVLCFPAGAPAASDRRVDASAAALGAFCVAAAYALSYAMMIPPILAADETFHFGSYAAVTHTPLVTEQAIGWARVNQVGRIVAHSTERFRPRDIGHPEPDVVRFDVHQTMMRSSLTARFWAMLGHILPTMPAQRLFVTVRVIYALLFAAAVAFAAALFVSMVSVRYPQLLVFPFLFVPALPFFGMHFSESALITSVSVLFVAALVVILLGDHHAHWIGLLLGLTSAAFLVGSRNSLPMQAMVATALLTRIVLGPRDHKRAAIKAFIFWSGFALGASTFSLVLTQTHREIIVQTLAVAATLVPRFLAALFGRIRHAWLLLPAAILGCLAEITFTSLRTKRGRFLMPALLVVTRIVPVAIAVLIAVSLIGSLWREYPTIENIQSVTRMPLREYLLSVAATGATLFRLTHPSLLMSTSFWVGFGWLDTIPGPVFEAVLVGLTSLSLIGLLLHVASTSDIRLFIGLVLTACGAAVTLAAYAYSAYATHTNLHGRYLVGWYLSGVAIAWMWPAISDSARRSTAQAPDATPRAIVLIVLSLLVHSYALCFILQRYF